MVCEVLLRMRPIPEGAVEPRGAAFRLRLTSPVHKEPRCPLVCLQKRPSETKKNMAGVKRKPSECVLIPFGRNAISNAAEPTEWRRGASHRDRK